mmetsp:Transcript_45360/g.101410  ORF Transcript_45360/g.101410 Transcript_45360/m.101410 type:complete len:202 (+) Transcript_45360:898-1503(+)
MGTRRTSTRRFGRILPLGVHSDRGPEAHLHLWRRTPRPTPHPRPVRVQHPRWLPQPAWRGRPSPARPAWDSLCGSPGHCPGGSTTGCPFGALASCCLRRTRPAGSKHCPHSRTPESVPESPPGSSCPPKHLLAGPPPPGSWLPEMRGEGAGAARRHRKPHLDMPARNARCLAAAMRLETTCAKTMDFSWPCSFSRLNLQHS